MNDTAETKIRARHSPDGPLWDPLDFLGKVTDIAPCVIYVFNHQTMSNEYSNDYLSTAMGYSVQEIQDMGENFMPNVCHPDDLPRVFANFGSIQDMQDGEIRQIEYRMKKKGGGWVWFLSRDTIFDRTADGAVQRVIGVATDITAQKEAEDLAIAQKKATDAANTELRAFAYAVSHDLKAPSNTLSLLLSEFAQTHDNTLDEDAQELFDLSTETVNRMRDLIEDVLGYTRIVGAEFEQEQVNLDQMFEQIIDDHRAEIENTGANLSVAPLGTIQGSAMQLRIMFSNMFSNAIKYRRPEVPLHISVKRAEKNRPDQVTIEIVDNGMGIERKDQRKIFSLFKRLHLNDEIPGTGLGLAICRRIAKGHGGDISVTSVPGEGSNFAVTIPELPK